MSPASHVRFQCSLPRGKTQRFLPKGCWWRQRETGSRHREPRPRIRVGIDDLEIDSFAVYGDGAAEDQPACAERCLVLSEVEPVVAEGLDLGLPPPWPALPPTAHVLSRPCDPGAASAAREGPEARAAQEDWADPRVGREVDRPG